MLNESSFGWNQLSLIALPTPCFFLFHHQKVLPYKQKSKVRILTRNEFTEHIIQFAMVSFRYFYPKS